MEKLDKLLQKKKKEGRELSPNEKDAKMSVVHALQKFAADEMGKKMKGSKEEHFRNKAKEGISNRSDAPEDYLQAKKSDEIRDPDEDKQKDFEQNPALGDTGEAEAVDGEDDDESHEDPMEEASESPEEEHSEDMSEEEIDAKLKDLMAKKAKMKKA